MHWHFLGPMALPQAPCQLGYQLPKTAPSTEGRQLHTPTPAIALAQKAPSAVATNIRKNAKTNTLWLGQKRAQCAVGCSYSSECTVQWAAHTAVHCSVGSSQQHVHCTVGSLRSRVCTGSGQRKQSVHRAVGSASRVCTGNGQHAECALCSGQREQCAVGCSYSSECTVQWSSSANGLTRPARDVRAECDEGCQQRKGLGGRAEETKHFPPDPREAKPPVQIEVERTKNQKKANRRRPSSGYPGGAWRPPRWAR